MSTISLFHVNAFSRQPFGGNPAVVALGPSQPDATLLAMAAEFNLSETAFLVPLGHARYQLRWFTPELEVDLCGHGTLAAAHVLWQTGRWQRVRSYASRPAAASCWPGAKGGGSGSIFRALPRRRSFWIRPMWLRSVAGRCKPWRLAPSSCWRWPARRRFVR